MLASCDNYVINPLFFLEYRVYFNAVDWNKPPNELIRNEKFENWGVAGSRLDQEQCSLCSCTDSVIEVTVEDKKENRGLRTELGKVQILENAGPVWAWTECDTERKGNPF